MYNPHLLECGACLTPFEDQQQVYPHFEDYLCVSCTPEYIRETRQFITWHAIPQDYIKNFLTKIGRT